MGARIAAARQDGSESDNSARQHTARSAGTTVDADLDSTANEQAQQSWLELQRAEEARLAAQLEKDTKVQTRRLNLKVSKYKVEIQEATKSVDDLVDVAVAELHASSDIVEAGTGLVEAKDIGLRRAKVKSANTGSRKEEAAHSQPTKGRGLLQSVQALSETTLKVVMRKKQLEEIVTKLHKEYTKERSQFQVLLADIQEQMKNLRAQKENAEFNLKDRTLQFETRLKTLQREYDDAKKKADILDVVNADLRSINNKQESDLIAVPRLEETYLRKARSLVLDKEKELTQKNIQLYKQQADIEQVTFWKSKALAYNETLKANEQTLISLKKQMAQVTHQNLGIMAESEQLKRENFALMCTGGGSGGGGGNEKGGVRPATTDEGTRGRHASPSGRGAASASRAATSGSTTAQNAVPFGGSPGSSPGAGGDSPQARHCGSNENNNRSSPPRRERGGRSSSPIRQRRMSAIDIATSGKSPMQIQLEKFKETNLLLQSKLEKANRALANQRAYPLYTSGQGLKMEDMMGEGESNKVGEAEFLEQLFDSDEDKEEISSGRMSLEEQMRVQQATRKASEDRIEKAVGISTAYKAKLKNLRESRPGVKHLRQIREKRDAAEAAQPKMF